MNEARRETPDKFPADDLKRQLRRLPAPIAPPGLERRLLAGIPEIKVFRLERRRRVVLRCALAASLAVALIIGAGLIVRSWPWTPIDQPLPALGALNNTMPQLILGKTTSPNFQETRPCDILPPF
jgi:hypothetical protein